MKLELPVEELKKTITVNLRESRGTSFFTAINGQKGQSLISSVNTNKISGKEFQIVRLNNEVFSFNRKVKDQLRFIIDSQGDIFDSSQEELKSEKESLKVLIILESPHRDEYNYSHAHYSNRPANGKTGEKIKKHIVTTQFLAQILDENKVKKKSIKELIELLIETIKIKDIEFYLKNKTSANYKGKIEITVMNRICYQTSLGSYYSGELIKPIRNNIFKALWNEQIIQNDFEMRLLKQPADIVINACTNEVDKNQNVNFSTYILNILRRNKLNCSLFEASHPIYWDSDYKLMKIE